MSVSFSSPNLFPEAKIKNGRSTCFSKVVPNKKRTRKEFDIDHNVDISNEKYKTLHVVKQAGIQQAQRPLPFDLGPQEPVVEDLNLKRMFISKKISGHTLNPSE